MLPKNVAYKFAEPLQKLQTGAGPEFRRSPAGHLSEEGACMSGWVDEDYLDNAEWQLELDAEKRWGFQQELQELIDCSQLGDTEAFTRELAEADVSDYLGKRSFDEVQQDSFHIPEAALIPEFEQPKLKHTPELGILGSDLESIPTLDWQAPMGWEEGTAPHKANTASAPVPVVACETYQRESRFAAWHQQQIPWACLWNASFRLVFTIDFPAPAILRSVGASVTVEAFFHWPDLKNPPSTHSRLQIYPSDPYPRASGAAAPLPTESLSFALEGPRPTLEVFVVPIYVAPKRLRPVVGLRMTLHSASGSLVVWEQCGYVRSRKPQAC